MVKIAHESLADAEAIREINLEVFETDAEAKLVDNLRGSVSPFISMVALDQGMVIGHILFTPVDVAGSGISALGLGPMAVTAQRQGHGVGSSLIKEGLNLCRNNNTAAVFALGEPGYYSRFGFELAAGKELYYKSDKFAPYFMLIELVSGSLDKISGEVRYHRFFDDI